MPRAFVALALCVATGLAAFDDAGAVGLGRVLGGVVLGQPLDIAVPLRLDEGETVPADCVSAEVVSGEQRIAASQVQARVESAASGELQLRVTTRAVIDEPVVHIALSVGCPPKLLRRFTTFADPPGVAPPPPVDDVVQSPQAPASAPRRVARESVATESARPAAPRRQSPAAQPPAARARNTPRARPAMPSPRLQLAPAEAAPSLVLAEAQAQASSARAAASAAQAVASAAQQRVRALEAELARTRAESQAHREAMFQMRSDLAQRDLAAVLLPWLLIAVLAVGVLAGWLWLRARRVERAAVHDPWWQHSTHVAESAFDPGALPSVHTAEDAPFDRTSRPARATAPVGDTAPGALQAVAAAPTAAPFNERRVTIDEQIDMEQQADFFMVLGQDEAAIDLLLTHLRGTGGTSPMPYLKLLEIYRRRDDREAYERIRVRFNQRFNAVAPPWNTDLSAGRTLEDYPAVMQRLQRSWISPLDAMADLEAMLFRRGEGAELFELPAYQEVLFLYQLARDLHQHEKSSENPPSDVDVLLPIDSGVTVRHYDLDIERTSAFGPRARRPEPLDIDLSELSRR